MEPLFSLIVVGPLLVISVLVSNWSMLTLAENPSPVHHLACSYYRTFTYEYMCVTFKPVLTDFTQYLAL